MKNTLKSIGAVVAGFLTVAVLSIVTDMVLEKTGIFPPPTEGLFITWMLLLALVYRTVYTVLGGYVVATLAPNRQMFHTKVLAALGTFFAVLGILQNLSMHLGPNWYPVLLALLAFPSVIAGGMLKTKASK